jgi:predicted O-linked N-acetylglucosamine transferase (SPINDLY family)
MLDSWPYNAHSTAADILWAGVPLLVYLPDYHDPDAAVQVPKMAARVSASLLHTMQLPHLIKSTVQEFEDEAVRFSHDRGAYEAVRNDLIQKRAVSSLYDLKAYARYHEMAYIELFERFKRGEEPSELTLIAV